MCGWIRKVTLWRSQVQTWELRAQTVGESPGSDTQERACQVWIGRGHLAVMSKCPRPLLSPSTGTSEDRNQSVETDADIRCRIHLQLVSPELPLTAGALRYAALPLQDSSISPAGVQQWLNTPKRPYQLFYYFSCGGGGGRQGGRNTFSVRRLGEDPTRPVGVWCMVIMQNLKGRLWLTRKWTRGALITQLRLSPFQGHSLYPYSSFVLYHSGPVSITYTEWIITACSPWWQQPTEVCTCGYISVKSHWTATALISHHQLGIFR